MALLTIQPTAVDQSIARAMARQAHPPLEKSAEVLTLAADERVLLAVIGGLFIASLFGSARQTEPAPISRRPPPSAPSCHIFSSASSTSNGPTAVSRGEAGGFRVPVNRMMLFRQATRCILAGCGGSHAAGPAPWPRGLGSGLCNRLNPRCSACALGE